MEMNVGRLDRILRILLGALLVVSAYTGVFGAWAYIGFIPLITGMVRWCPLYTMLGIQTAPLHEQVHDK